MKVTYKGYECAKVKDFGWKLTNLDTAIGATGATSRMTKIPAPLPHSFVRAKAGQPASIN
jgi:hypothetical protein